MKEFYKWLEISSLKDQRRTGNYVMPRFESICEDIAAREGWKAALKWSYEIWKNEKQSFRYQTAIEKELEIKVEQDCEV